MKWVRVGNSHWNTDRINAFTWNNGRLAVWWCDAAEAPEIHQDPAGVLYNQLCKALGVTPVEEDIHG
jgi:hypothetical protein